jgi:hypothetical protein
MTKGISSDELDVDVVHKAASHHGSSAVGGPCQAPIVIDPDDDSFNSACIYLPVLYSTIYSSMDNLIEDYIVHVCS